jgi:hypothetical protein
MYTVQWCTDAGMDSGFGWAGLQRLRGSSLQRLTRDFQPSLSRGHIQVLIH